MNRLINPIIILVVCFISACSPASGHYTELESRVVDAISSQSILVQVDHGEVTILESEDVDVGVGGRVLSPDDLEYQVSSTDEQISIKAFSHQESFSAPPLQMVVQIPAQMKVKVETDNASVFAGDFQGELEVASTSGNITVENVIGKITLRSNRGNIVVRESSGVISVVGNYGALTLQNASGETAASTIMGNIIFDGLIQKGDIVRLETDHGSVSINLSPNSALGIRVRSTSGDVACMLPDITSSTRTCDGEFHFDGGNLSVRTVSGGVTLQLTP